GGKVPVGERVRPLRYLSLDADGVDVERGRIHVRQHGLGAGVNDRVDGGAEGQGRRDDLVSRPNIGGEDAQVKGRRAGVHGYGEARLLVRAKVLLESGDFGAGAQPSGLQTVENLFLFLFADQRRPENQELVGATDGSGGG